MLDRNSADVFASVGRAIATLWEYGQTRAALQCAGAVIVQQRRDGAFSGNNGRASALTTAAVMRGLLALSGETRPVRIAARRAAEFLIGWTVENAAIAADIRTNPCPDFKAAAQRVDSLAYSLPPLLQAACAWDEADWEKVVRRGVARLLTGYEQTVSKAPLKHRATLIEALLDLNCDVQAWQSMNRWQPFQSRQGFVADSRDGLSPSVAATARMATVWYRLGERDRADRAVSWLVRQWRPEGGFHVPPRSTCSLPNQIAGLRDCELFLRAVRWQVQTLFDGDLQGLPERIDDSDGRMQAVYRWLGHLPAAGRLVDVGCGAGRFLSRIAAARPKLRLAGVDISAPALAKLPSQIEKKVGSLLRIPYPDGAFDGALAVESLEHALLPSHAVAELCRVVRPGGWVLIIDKNGAFQPRSVHEPWERWFAPHQAAAWLSQNCDHVHVEPIAHGSHSQPDGLFLAWTAQRR